MELSTFESELRLNDILSRLKANYQRCTEELDKVLQVVPNWSKTAINNYPDKEMIAHQAGEVIEWYKRAAIGIPVANMPDKFPLPIPLNNETAKKYIAEMWGIETTDIDIMIAMTE